MAGSPLSAPRELRFRWYLQVEKYGRSVAEISRIFGISRKTYYKWYSHDHGLTTRVYRPRKTHPHTKLVGNLRVIVVDLKQKYNFGPQKMSVYLKKQYGVEISHQTIYKFFKKKHLIRKPQKKQRWYTPLKTPYYAETPGENVQLDVKYVPGPDRRWNYQYRFMDTVTNMQYSVTTEIRDALTTVFTFKEATKYFPFPLTGIQTDNGGEFRGKFHEYLVRKKIIHRYIPKRSAPWNGKVERANRSVDDEFYLNYGRPWKTISEYTRWYNHERPHFGKGMNGMTPFEKYLSLREKCNP